MQDAQESHEAERDNEQHRQVFRHQPPLMWLHSEESSKCPDRIASTDGSRDEETIRRPQANRPSDSPERRAVEDTEHNEHDKGATDHQACPTPILVLEPQRAHMQQEVAWRYLS
mmetsp:Transcript_40665/g.107749  ORF Transcript_40665/g.107749 Transcript_40665/m.107749 type:complete len:114 (+) Transcript_40665:1411-1752(+)